MLRQLYRRLRPTLHDLAFPAGLLQKPVRLFPAFLLHPAADHLTALVQQIDVLHILVTGRLGGLKNPVQPQSRLGDGTGGIDFNYPAGQSFLCRRQLFLDRLQLHALVNQHFQQIRPGKPSELLFRHGI